MDIEKKEKFVGIFLKDTCRGLKRAQNILRCGLEMAVVVKTNKKDMALVAKTNKKWFL